MQPDFQSFVDELEKISSMAGFKKALERKGLTELAAMASRTRAPIPRISAFPAGVKPASSPAELLRNVERAGAAGLARRQTQLHNVEKAQAAIMDAMKGYKPKSREEILEAASALRRNQ